MVTTDFSIWAEIDLDAIESNFNLLSDFGKGNTKNLAVLKADAYGHGAVHIGKQLEGRADYFGVARIEEAIELRSNNINTNILILGHTPETRYEKLISHRITPTVYSFEEANKLNMISKKMGKITPVHIAVDTGMSRIGFDLSDESVKDISDIASLEYINLEGLFSHLANADDLNDTSFTELQKNRFNTFIDRLTASGVAVPVKHLYNSAGICSLNSVYDMNRMGICLYGCLPDEAFNSAGTERLRPVMSLYSRVIHVHRIEKGTAVGYNCTYKAERPMSVATISAGYADGYPRLLSNNGFVLINGKRAKIIGRICMDQLMCDVTDISTVKTGDAVTLMGIDGSETVTAGDIGNSAGTNSYEILCGISKRVPRVYIKNSEVTHIHCGI